MADNRMPWAGEVPQGTAKGVWQGAIGSECVIRLCPPRPPVPLGGPKIALQGGDGMGARRRRGGGVPEMGFRAGPLVLCKDGCCHQRRRNTNFGPENFFSLKNFPPHMCSQNDQRDVGIILSRICWGRTPPPPRNNFLPALFYPLPLSPPSPPLQTDG